MHVFYTSSLQFADNAGVRVQHYTVGQVVPIRIDNRARHTGIAVWLQCYTV